MSMLILFVIALVPGLVNWWTGRRLLAQRDDPALAERLLDHNTRMLVLAFVVLVGVGVGLTFEDDKALAGMVAVLPLLGTLAGGFPLRRSLYEETWSFPAYLAFMLRLLVGVVGFWILLLTTPYLVMGAGELRWLAAAVLGLVLVLWNRGYSALLVRITGARPLAGDARFDAYFDAVDERSGVPPPRRYVAPVPGGRLVNAIALPSDRQSRVVFTSSLLELLEPDEVGAIYAHEVGHLEYFRGRKLRNLGIVVHLMTAAAVLWGLLPWSGGYLSTLSWPLLFIVLARWRTHWMRGHETDTDLRAVELCGDADALIRALVRLHQLMLLPRRLALETERAMSHPSLARRIQAIRESAGLDAEPESEGAGEAEPSSVSPADGEAPTAALCLRTRKAGVWVLLEPERLSWFEGVPAELGADPPAIDALQRSAAASRTLVYGQLAELRLEVRRGKAALVVVDGRGGKRTFAVAAADVAAVQRRLDAVDARLGTPTGEAASKAARSWHRLLAAVAAVSSVLPPVAGVVSVPALFALVRPRPAFLAAAGLTGLAASVYRFIRVPVHSAGPELAGLNTWLLGLASLLLLASGIAWSRRAPTMRSQGAWPLAATCLSLTPVHWGVVLFMSGTGDGLDVYRLSSFLYWAPGAFLLPLAAAAALFFVRTRRGRLTFAFASVLVLVPLAASTTAFRNAFVHDPLVPRSPVAASVSGGLEEVARSALDFNGSEVALSPSGETWAVCVANEWGVCDSRTWKLGRFDGSPLPSGTEELADATELAFVDDERLVLLRRQAAPGGSSAYESGHAVAVVRQSLGDGGARPIELPYAGDYESHLAASGESWRVVTLAFRGERHLMRRFTGGWSEDEVEETVWDLGDLAAGWIAGVAGRGDHALAVRTRFEIEAGSPQTMFQELLGLSPGAEERSLVATRLALSCEIFPPSEKGLCIARDRDRTYLWRVDPTGNEEPRVVGTFRSARGEELLAARDGVLILTPHGSPYWLDHAGERLVELAWPVEDRSPTVAISGSGLVAELRGIRGEEGGVLVLYRLSVRGVPGSNPGLGQTSASAQILTLGSSSARSQSSPRFRTGLKPRAERQSPQGGSEPALAGFAS